MSENLCYTDAYRRSIEASVVAVDASAAQAAQAAQAAHAAHAAQAARGGLAGDASAGGASAGEPSGALVILDRTVFYPGGGGQPADRGWLRSVDGREWVVRGAKKAGDEIAHELEPGVPPPAAGERVTAEIDWDRRHALMRTHTALHTLCGVVWRDYRAQVTGGNMEPGAGRMDFEFETMSAELVGTIEERVNAELAAARDVRVKILPRDEAFAIPDLIRTKINLLPAGISEIRTIEIVGLDLQADGGTHVANTREVGSIRVTGYESKGRINKRIRIQLEG